MACFYRFGNRLAQKQDAVEQSGNCQCFSCPSPKNRILEDICICWPSTEATNLLLSLVNQGQFKMANLKRNFRREKGRLLAAIFVNGLVMGMLSSCTTAQPLSITLYNPKTNVSRTCKARSTSVVKTDVDMLSRAVESCAQQLEAHGFVRTDSPPEPEAKPAP